MMRTGRQRSGDLLPCRALVPAYYVRRSRLWVEMNECPVLEVDKLP